MGGLYIIITLYQTASMSFRWSCGFLGIVLEAIVLERLPKVFNKYYNFLATEQH